METNEIKITSTGQLVDILKVIPADHEGEWKKHATPLIKQFTNWQPYLTPLADQLTNDCYNLRVSGQLDEQSFLNLCFELLTEYVDGVVSKKIICNLI